MPIVVHEQLHDSQISCALVSDDGQLIVLGGDDSVISVWRRHPVHKYRQLLAVGTLCAHTDRITCLAASTAFRILLSGSADRQVIVWDINRVQQVRRLPDLHSCAISAVTIDSVNGELVTCAGTEVFVWTINGLLVARKSFATFDGVDETISKSDCTITCVAVAREPEAVIITGHADGSLRFLSIEIESGASAVGTSTGLILRHHIMGAHSSPVTALHTSNYDLVKMWSGDAIGDIKEWRFQENEKHWRPDAEVLECLKCTAKFGTFLRKHHCRDCGEVFCDNCSRKRKALPSKALFAPVRVCDDCFAK
jgi:WD40 repeat protein